MTDNNANYPVAMTADKGQRIDNEDEVNAKWAHRLRKAFGQMDSENEGTALNAFSQVRTMMQKTGARFDDIFHRSLGPSPEQYTEALSLNKALARQNAELRQENRRFRGKRTRAIFMKAAQKVTHRLSMKIPHPLTILLSQATVFGVTQFLTRDIVYSLGATSVASLVPFAKSMTSTEMGPLERTFMMSYLSTSIAATCAFSLVNYSITPDETAILKSPLENMISANDLGPRTVVAPLFMSDKVVVVKVEGASQQVDMLPMRDAEGVLIPARSITCVRYWQSHWRVDARETWGTDTWKVEHIPSNSVHRAPTCKVVEKYGDVQEFLKEREPTRSMNVPAGGPSPSLVPSGHY